METVILETEYGKIKGLSYDDCDVFYGIPYAKPPVGSKRWRAPEMAEPWQGELDGTRFPNKCPQGELSGIPFYGKEFYDDPVFDPPASEDCLYLNVWKPKNIPDGSCPVLVWIHGGAFEQGHSCEKEFDGRGYAKRNVVFVSINYRLGPFGFLALPERYAEDGHTGNYGLLDQLMALRFLQKTVSRFGGDPDQITIMGQSAGSFSAQALWASPLGKGLFHQVILMSGAGSWEGFPVEHSLEDAYSVTAELMRYLRIKTADELEAKSSAEILDAFQLMKQGRSTLPVGPTVDGHVLPNSVVDLFRDGAVRSLPSMIGATSEDILWELPSESGKGRAFDQVLRINASLRDNHKTLPYLYYFGHGLPGSEDGAFHSSELWYVFGTLKRGWRPWTERDYALADRVQDYIASFVKIGVPDPLTWNSNEPFLIS